MQSKLPKNRSDVVDTGDEHDGDKEAENRNDKTANSMVRRSEPEQREE